jgi:uncharacterized protein (DUF58 family)
MAVWTWKARAWGGLAVLAALLGLATARWFPFLLGVSLTASLAYAHLFLRPDESLTGSRELSLDQVPEAESVQVHTAVANGSDDRAFLELEDDLPREFAIEEGSSATAVALGPGEGHELAYRAEPRLFGIYDVGHLQARTEDALGLVAERQTPIPATELVAVPGEPDLEEPDPEVTEFQTFQGEYTVNRPGDGFDFYGLREYADGDSFRDINWKASAKTGDIMVNEFELSTGSEITILVDGRAITDVGPEDRTPFVLASRAVACLLEAFFDRRDSPRVIVYGEDLDIVHPGPPDRVVNESLESLAAWEPAGDLPLLHHLEDVLPRVAPGTPVVIVSPFVADPTIMECVTRMLAHDIPVTAVAVPLPDLGASPDAEAEALAADRQGTIESLRGFDVDVLRPAHLENVQEVAT